MCQPKTTEQKIRAIKRILRDKTVAQEVLLDDIRELLTGSRG